MLRQAFVAPLAAAVVGCINGGGGRRQAVDSSAHGAPHASATTTPTVDAPAEALSDTELAAWAGDAEFPAAQPRNDWRVAAIVTKDRRAIKLYNFESTPLRAVNVWVNGAYLQPLSALPAHSKAIIRGDKLFNKGGKRFSERGEEVTRVQLETREGLYDVMGPSTE